MGGWRVKETGANTWRGEVRGGRSPRPGGGVQAGREGSEERGGEGRRRGGEGRGVKEQMRPYGLKSRCDFASRC